MAQFPVQQAQSESWIHAAEPKTEWTVLHEVREEVRALAAVVERMERMLLGIAAVVATKEG